jgi:hypothetical protein
MSVNQSKTFPLCGGWTDEVPDGIDGRYDGLKLHRFPFKEYKPAHKWLNSALGQRAIG